MPNRKLSLYLNNIISPLGLVLLISIFNASQLWAYADNTDFLCAGDPKSPVISLYERLLKQYKFSPSNIQADLDKLNSLEQANQALIGLVLSLEEEDSAKSEISQACLDTKPAELESSCLGRACERLAYMCAGAVNLSMITGFFYGLYSFENFLLCTKNADNCLDDFLSPSELFKTAVLGTAAIGAIAGYFVEDNKFGLEQWRPLSLVNQLGQDNQLQLLAPLVKKMRSRR